MFFDRIDRSFISRKYPTLYKADSCWTDASLNSTVKMLTYNRQAVDAFAIYITTQAEFDTSPFLGTGNSLIFATGIDATLDAVIEDDLNEQNGFVELKKVRTFFSTAFKTRCFYHETSHVTYLIIYKANIGIFHYAQCSIPALIPWVFTKENPLTEFEWEVVKSLKERTSEKYLSLIAQFEKEHHIKDEYIQSAIHLVENGNQRRYIEDLKAEIANKENYLRDLYTTITRKSSELDNLKRSLFSAESGVAGREVLKDILLKSPVITVEDIIKESGLEDDPESPVSMNIRIDESIEFFDEVEANAMINNPFCSVFYPHISKEVYCSEQLNNAYKKFLSDVFEERKYKIRTTASLNILDDMKVSCRIVDIDSEIKQNHRIPNPHINTFECFGGYYSMFAESARSRDWISLISQVIASTKSLNLGDSTVTRSFIETLIEHKDAEIFESDDGKLFSMTQIVDSHKEVENV